MEKNRRWKCMDCHCIMPESEMLRAPSPFDSSCTLVACPHCRVCGTTLALVCDEPGCTDEASCGWPTGDENDAWGG
jgi:hypothetical protein